MKNLEIAKKYEDYIISMRRYFHENPELSDKEVNTIKTIASELDKMGIEYVIVEKGGILAKITGPKDNGKSVLLRADCDALPVQETPDNLKPGMRTCVSKNPGVMHACGHDVHTAMLLGAAKVLLEKKDEIEGTIYLCFERGEEITGNVEYIFAYIEKNNIKIDSVYGIHLYADAPSGYMGINDAGTMAGSMGFMIEIEGKGGHGSRPDQSNNPIDCFVAIYNRLEALRLTKVDPFKACAYSVGMLNSGIQGNVIPQKLTFAGTVRTFDSEEVGMVMYNEIKKAVDGICAAYDCKPTYLTYGLPGFGVVNDADCAKFARKVISEELGSENVGPIDPWMASESFARYLAQWPGVFALLGIKNEEKGTGAAHHNQAFDIDEDVLVKGSAGAATYAIEYLKADDFKVVGRKQSYKDVMKAIGQENRISEVYGE